MTRKPGMRAHGTADAGPAAAGERRNAMRGEAEIACDLGVFTADERNAHRLLSRRVLSAVRQFREEGDGYTLRFQLGGVVERDVLEWIEAERRCCPFLRFDVERTARDGLSVRVGGPEGAKEVLRQGLERASGPSARRSGES